MKSVVLAHLERMAIVKPASLKASWTSTKSNELNSVPAHHGVGEYVEGGRGGDGGRYHKPRGAGSHLAIKGLASLRNHLRVSGRAESM